MGLEIHHSQQSGWDEAVWDQFVAGHAAAHPLQLSAWGQLKREFGWEDARLLVREEGNAVAGAQILFRKLPRLGFLPLRVAYAPKGPLVDWENGRQVAALFTALHGFCRRRGAIMLKIEPERADTPVASQQMQALNFRPGRTVQPRTTLWLDLRPEEETLLASFKQKWRYNVRLAQRKGGMVREGTADDLPAFVALMQTTGDRNDFAVHSPAYYRRFWELFAPPGRAALLLAEVEGQVLAGLMVAHLAGPGVLSLRRLGQRGPAAHAQSPATMGSDALGQGAGLHGLRSVGRARRSGVRSRRSGT